MHTLLQWLGPGMMREGEAGDRLENLDLPAQKGQEGAPRADGKAVLRLYSSWRVSGPRTDSSPRARPYHVADVLV